MPQRRVLSLSFAVSAVFLLLFTTPAIGAEPADSVPVDQAEGTGLWFLELRGAPRADGGNAADLQAEHASFRAAAARTAATYRERYAFDTLWNGFSVASTAQDAARLSRLPEVKAVYPVVTIDAPMPPGGDEEADLATALAMTGADVAQSDLGLSGTGIRVAVMDTGIDYTHPDLGECAAVGPSCRVTTGWDFVGDAFNGADPASSTPVPDPDPMDCNGHGTHVTGIVGADGTVTGVAPGVSFGAYKVFGCAGSTSADIMIAAMERALADGMQVLNMSIGSSFQWPNYPTAEAGDRLVNRGVTVVASIGNSGATGLYSTGAPGVGRKTIGVASFDNTHITLPVFTVSPDDTAIGYAPASAAPEPPTGGSMPMARTGNSGTTNDACGPLAAGSLTGHSALIRRGGCSFHTKALNAQNSGAAAVVLYNNTAGRLNATVAGSPAISIPVVTVSASEGGLIDGRLASGAVTMTWTDQSGAFPNSNGNLISSFSSFGLSPDLAVKPDIGAPGGLIRSTYPMALGGYETLSGTSMASPHVAGAVALLLEARPQTSSQEVRGILQNAADPRPWWGNPDRGFLDNVHRQGAGMLDIPGAIQSTTSAGPAMLSLGESEMGPATQTLTLTNHGPAAKTYSLSHTPALSTGPATFSPSVSTEFASASFTTNEVTVPAGGSATVDVTITANASLADRSMYGGYLVATDGDGEVSRVPYAGLKGDYQSVQVLTPTPTGFPWLAQVVGTNYADRPAGATYTLQGDDIPYFLVHLDHQSRRLRMTVRDAESGKSWHRAGDFQYLGRNSTSTSFFAFAWDGTTTKGSSGKGVIVPNGTYVVDLEVVKPLGDESNPGHVEIWTSPPITLARP